MKPKVLGSLGRPKVLIVDDDPVFNKLLQVVLKKFGLQPETFSQPAELLERLSLGLPSLCIIDLNLGPAESGFDLVQAIRKNHSADLPIFIASGDSDRATIAHAIELGANDYLIKPLDRDVLAAKLMNYVHSDELADIKMGFPAGPEGEFKVSLQAEYSIRELDELGITLLGSHLLTKGSVINVSGDFLSDALEAKKPVLLTVTSTWVESDESAYGAYLEFDPTDEELSRRVRAWLSRQVFKS